MTKRKQKVLNVTDGGRAFPIAPGYFLMKGRTHEQGGIGIGNNLEVEDGEIIKTNKKSLKVLSNAPIMNGISPAQMALGGLNNGTFEQRFNQGFKYQERFKDKNGLKDDGTKAKFGKTANLEVPRIYLSEDEVIDEIEQILYNGENEKDIKDKLTKYWESIKENVSIPVEFKHNVEQDINHYLKYPISSAVKVRSDVNWRKKDEINNSFSIPADYNKIIKLSNAGKSTGLKVTKNMLDSIAFHGGKEKVDTVRMLGVPSAETRFGKFKGTTFLNPETIRADDDYYANVEGTAKEYFLRQGSITPAELVNNHSYFTNDAYQSLIGEVHRQTGVGHGPTGGYVDADIEFNEFNDEVEKAMKKGFNYAKKQASKQTNVVHPLDHAFRLDKTGNYNPGIGNHNELVEKAGQELWLSPEIQDWWKESGKYYYNKGVMSKKLGGKTYKDKLQETSDKIREDLRRKAFGVSKENTFKFRGGDFGGAGASGSFRDPAKSRKYDSRGRYYKRNDPSTGERKKAIFGKQLTYKDILEKNFTKPINITVPDININGYNNNQTFNNDRLSFQEMIYNAFDKPTINVPNINVPNINYTSLTTNTPMVRKDLTLPKVTPHINNKVQKITKDKPLKGNPLTQTSLSEAPVTRISFLEANPNFLGNIIGGAANIIGSGISYGINKNMLNNLESPRAPYTLQSTKLKTNININPKVREIKNTLNKYRKLIDENTISSQVALARLRHGYVDSLENLLTVFGQKENQETSLINQDRLNQQEVFKYNLENYNDWINKTTDFKNRIIEAKGENAQAFTQNLTGTLGNFLNNNAQWRNSMANITALSAAHPDVTPELMYGLGLPYSLWLKQRNDKRARKK